MRFTFAGMDTMLLDSGRLISLATLCSVRMPLVLALGNSWVLNSAEWMSFFMSCRSVRIIRV
jgi:hypothetical protein